MGSRSRRTCPGLLPDGRYPVEPERLYVPEPGKPPPLGRGTYSPSPPYGSASEAPQASARMLWWCPRGMPWQLAAVQAPKGSTLDESGWWVALADRVQQLVDREPDPEEAARWAAKAMGRPGMTGHLYAGEVLVRYNLDLRTSLMVAAQSMRRYPFPGKVRVESAAMREELEETDLELWVELAVAQVSSSGWD